MNKLTNMHTT